MAVLTAKGISSLAVELLTRQLVLPNTVSRIPGGEFSGSNGDTITVRVPQPGSSRVQATRGATIEYDDVVEIPVDVELTHLYHGKLTSDEEMTLDIESFGRQVTRVQVDAVATGAEDALAGVMNGLDVDGALGVDLDAEILEAREFLGDNNAPASDRFLAVSPGAATLLLQHDKFVKVNESGSTSALREAILGRLYGFTVVESNGLTGVRAVAYHRSGFAFANRVPVAPRGATESAVASSGGIGLRQIFQYVPDKLSDASVVSTFAGAAAVVDDDGSDGTEAKRFYVLDAEGPEEGGNGD